MVASKGYPASSSSGDVISGLNASGQVDGSSAVVFHAGTDRAADGNWITAGGRVLAVTALGATIDEARVTAYDAVDHITFDGAQCRRDIAAEHIS